MNSAIYFLRRQIFHLSRDTSRPFPARDSWTRYMGVNERWWEDNIKYCL